MPKRSEASFTRASAKDWMLRGVARVALAEPLVRVVGRRRQRDVDAGLDPQVAAVLALQRMLRMPSLDSMAPPEARRFAEDGLSVLDIPPMPMQRIVDTTVPGRAGAIAVRMFEPHDASPHWIVYLHGGGGVIGSIRSSEPVTRMLAAQTRCTVASVEYRLGPEHKHPAAIDDAVDAWTALVARVPSGGKVAVAGDSFGGFLAAQVDRAAQRRPDLQVLIYPIVDMTLTSPSIDHHADGYLLTRSIMHYFRNHYLNATDDRRAISPRYWTDVRGAAPAVIATAGYDPLVDEGDEYVEQLRAAGVRVRHRRYPSLVHGFLGMGGVVKAARAAADDLCSDIRELMP